MNGESLI